MRIALPRLRVIKKVFAAWHLFRGDSSTREELQRTLAPPEWLINRVLPECAILGTGAKVSRFCENMPVLEAALWTFARRLC
jgi:hypothetical protein